MTPKQVKIYSALVVGSFVLGSLMWLYWPNAVAGTLIGGSIGGVIGYWVQRLVFVPWKARKVYDQQQSLKESIEFSWSSDGLFAKTDIASSKTPWNHYIRWRENADVFNLYHSDLLFQIMPKRIFVAPEYEREFRQYLAGIKNA